MATPRVFRSRERRAFGLGAPALLLALGCGDDKTTDPPPAATPYFPSDYLATYSLVRDCRFSVEHDGFFIAVHCNPSAAPAYQSGVYPFVEGTVIVKTLYNNDDCTGVAGYAVMKKGAPGSAPSTGDWSWQDVGADRSVLQEGSIQACISCHTGCTEGRDFTCTNP